MMTMAYLLVLAVAGGGTVSLPEGGQVVVDLAADRETYHVGEAVQLTLTARNIGRKTVWGYVLLQPYLPRQLKSSTLVYCRGSAPCIEFLGEIPHIEEKNMAVLPVKLGPGQRQRSEFVAALNPKTRDLVLSEPGDYEFRWITWGIHERRGADPSTRGTEFSVSVFVRVLPVPPSELVAYSYYVESGLTKIAQYDLTYFDYDDKLRQAAHDMLVRYPGSIYSEAVGRGFAKLLDLRVLRGIATPEDAAVLTQLRTRAAER
jgi:hypothetical protein